MLTGTQQQTSASMHLLNDAAGCLCLLIDCARHPCYLVAADVSCHGCLTCCVAVKGNVTIETSVYRTMEPQIATVFTVVMMRA